MGVGVMRWCERRRWTAASASAPSSTVRLCLLLASLLFGSVAAPRSAHATLDCDIATNLAPETSDRVQLSTSNLNLIASTVDDSTHTLHLTSSSVGSQAFGAYFKHAFRVVNGFRATFDFRVPVGNPSEGFAFVFQGYAPAPTGGASANLGYNIPKSVAVEFDMNRDTTIQDTANSNHVEVHTAYEATNSADNNVARLPPISTSDPGVAMGNGGTYTATINYIPDTVQLGSAKITVKVVPKGSSTGPTLETTIDSDRVGAMLTNGVAWVGFTSSTSATIQSELHISNFMLATIPVAAERSFVVDNQLSSGQTAANAKGTTRQAQVQMVDKCGTNMPINYNSSTLSVRVVNPVSGSAVSVNGSAVTDLANGRFDVYWWAATAAIPQTVYAIDIKLNGDAITGSPFRVTVVPGPPLAAASTLNAPIPTAYIAGQTESRTLTLRDRLGNPTPLPSGWSIQAGFESSSDSLVTYSVPISTNEPAQFKLSLKTETARTSGVAVQVSLVDPTNAQNRVIQPATAVTVAAGPPAAANSLMSGTGLVAATAAVNATITLAVLDAYNNPVTTSSNVTVAGQLAWAGTGSGPTIPFTVTSAGGNQYTLTYQTTKAGFYTATATINGVSVGNSGSPQVYPGPVDRGDVTDVIPTGTAGSPTSFTIQAYDEYNNARISANDENPFTIALSTTDAPSTYLSSVECKSGAIPPPPNDYVSQFSCVASSSGRYLVSLVAKKALTYKVAIMLGGISGKASSITPGHDTFAVVPTIPNAAHSTLSGLSATSTAGVEGTFQLTIRDVYDNERKTTDDVGFLSQYILATATDTATIESPVKTQNEGIYTFKYTATRVGNYSVTVRVSGDSVPSSGVSSTWVKPAPLSPANTYLRPQPGLNGGIAGQIAQFDIQARDAFDNNLLQESNDDNSFTVTIIVSGTPTSSATITAHDDGIYTAVYTVPGWSSANPHYTIVTSAIPAGGSAVQIDSRIATVGESADQSLAALEFSTGTELIAGQPATLVIQDYDSLGVKATTDDAIYDLVFTPFSPNPPPITIGAVTIACQSGVTDQSCAPKSATFTPSFADTYRVQLYSNSVETNASVANNYNITVKAGAPDPARTIYTRLNGTTAVAGADYMFTASLADAYGNKVAQPGVSFNFTSTEVFELRGTPTYADGLYSITIRFLRFPSQSPQQQVAPMVDGVSTLGFTVTVFPAGIDGSQSSVTPVQSVPLVVDEPSQPLFITLKDAFGNSIMRPQFTCQATLNNPGASASDPLVQTSEHMQNSDQIKLTFTATQSDYHTSKELTIKCDGVTITNPAATQLLKVVPSALDESASSVELPATPATAASESVFRLHLRDGHDNPWGLAVGTPPLTALYSVIVDYNPRIIVDKLQAAVSEDSTAPGQGIYTVRFTPTYSSTNNYTFIFQLNGNTFRPGGMTTSMRVVAGAAVLSNTQLPVAGLPNSQQRGQTIPAGHTYRLMLQWRDVNRNPLTSGGPSDLQPFFYHARCDSTNTLNDVTANFTLKNVTDLHNGSYAFEFRTEVADLYFFNVVVPGQALIANPTCQTIPPSTSFTVSPLAADRSATLVSDIFDGRAGDEMKFNVTLRDQYKNPIANSSDYTISLGAASLCTANTDGYPSITAGDILRAGDGPTIAIGITVNISNHYRVPVLLDGQLIAAVPGVCPTVFVQPALIAAVLFNSSANVTAGLPARLELQTKDRFGNAITTTGPAASSSIFHAVFTRQGGAPYVVRNSSVASNDTNYPIIEMTFAVAGTMSVDVTLPADPLDPNSFNQTWSTQVEVLPAACAVDDPSKPYRCPTTRGCVANYTDCPGYTPCNGVICPDTGVCAASLAACNTTNICTAGTSFCSLGTNVGYCTLPSNSSVLDSSCPIGTLSDYCPLLGLVQCLDGQCRKSGECPSTSVCPPFTVACPDGRSCATSVHECPPLPTQPCSAPTPYQCRDARCVRRAEDCGSDVTCAHPSHVVCPDGSCRPSASECRETFICPFNMVKCGNGECRHRLTDCPSATTCKVGEVKCENGACRSNLAACEAALQCTSGVRCADGTCRPNPWQCPTAVTCPSAFPVLCADGSCVRDTTECRTQRTCPTSTPVLCPDGTCSVTLDTCPTTPTCPLDKPTRCADGSCVAAADQCPLTAQPPPVCPPHRPLRCSDGSCVGDWSFCPTRQIRCFDYAPVQCPDGRCVSSVEMCVAASVESCPAGQIRCPLGGCAWSRSLCPTPVTCGVGYVRGTDGSCHSGTDLVNATSLPFRAGASPFCPADSIICPQHHQGATCAKTLADCPQDVTCSFNRPVRCSDASCAATLRDCPTVTEINTNTLVCPASSTTSAGECGVSTTCPSYAPVKCWDESCRMLPEDCPPQAKCDSTNNYLCSTGQCTSSPLICTPGQKCNEPDKQIKCPWSTAGASQCVANITHCPNIFEDFPANVCPDSAPRCRVGYCARDATNCEALTCPPHIPHACPSGLCTRSADECEATNGCPYDEPIKCQEDGRCVAADALCPPDGSTPCPSGDRCLDGSCPTSVRPCPVNATGCLTGQVQCADGRCANKQAECTDGTDHYNACPAYRPYRCADGYCAKSSYLCPIIPSTLEQLQPKHTSRATRAFRCADGSQVEFAAQCPTLRPCPSGQRRCDTGRCVSDLAECPLFNPCSLVYPNGVRCPTGHCAASIGACLDESSNEAGGCPTIAPVKRPDGQCVSGPTSCDEERPAMSLPANGCPDNTPYKCLDGSCSSDFNLCPAASGCPASTPVLCADGSCVSAGSMCPSASGGMETPCGNGGMRCPNGQCKTDWSQCQHTNGCPIHTPIRCADGSCKRFPAGVDANAADVCQATVTCDASTPYLCRDQTCVSHPRFCRPILPCYLSTLCPGNRFICQPRNETQTCPQVDATCPPHSPVLCPDGACKPSVAQCLANTRQDACEEGEVRCFDGSCQKSGLYCAAQTWRTFHMYDNPSSPANFSLSAQHDNSTCMDAALTLCSDGSCVPHANECPMVRACPVSLPRRCPDGSCINEQTGACADVASCPSGWQRCEDGVCRRECLPFNGCPRDKPYSCVGRKESCTPDRATCEPPTQTILTRRRLMQLSSSTGGAPPEQTRGQEACINCENSIPAIPQAVVLRSDADQTIDVSIDGAGVPHTQLHIPAGSFRQPAKSIRVEPVPSAGLSFPVSPVSQSSMPQGPFYFATNVLSTPFKFSLDQQGGLAGPLSVSAMIDNMIYDPFASSDGSSSEQRTLPCQLQGPTFSLVPDPDIYDTVAEENKYKCGGSLTLTATTMSLHIDPTCDAIQLEGEYTMPGGGISCYCFNITASEAEQPGSKPVFSDDYYEPDSAWRRFTDDSQVCFHMAQSSDEYRLSVYTRRDYASQVCPYEGAIRNVLFWRMSRDAAGGDGCGGASQGGNRVMDPRDICLATVQPALGTWGCIQPERADRLSHPTWSADSGRPQYRVQAEVATDEYEVLAFAYIPLQPAPVEAPPECDIICEYGTIILIICCCFVGFMVIMGYVLWRFMRYREKYLAQKATLADLREHARDIDENRGGLGVADDEVVMRANPMIVQMQELDRQLERVNQQMDTQKEMDQRAIEQLSQDRERLHAEIQRVKQILASAQKTSATRLEDTHMTSAAIAMPPPMPAGRPLSATSHIAPMEMEMMPTQAQSQSQSQSSVPASAPAQDPTRQRHDFAQVRRAAKKKDNM